MKLHRVVFFVTFLAFMHTASAQVSKCADNISAFKNAVLAGKYEEAAGQIAALKKDCPRVSEDLYTYGNRVFLYNVEAARTDADKKKAVEEALAFTDLYVKNYPSGSGEIAKAMLLSSQGAADKDLFPLLDHAYSVNKANFTDYRAIELYFRLYYAKFSAKEKGFTTEALLQKYTDLLGHIAEVRNNVADKRAKLLSKQKEQEIEQEESMFLADTKYDESSLDAVADNMAKQVSPSVDCKSLEAFYGSEYEKNSKSAAWINGMVIALKNARCTKTDLYFNAVSSLYGLRPTYDVAYEMAQLYQKKNNIAKTVECYEAAAKMNANVVRKADVFMAIAELYRNSDKAKAKQYALKAAEANTKSGMPYLFIAEQYVSLTAKDCDLSEFDRKALVFAAIATLKKAEVAEPRFKNTVASMEQGYLKRIPTKKEAKAAKKGKGDVITYGCWINETVTLPKLK